MQIINISLFDYCSDLLIGVTVHLLPSIIYFLYSSQIKSFNMWSKPDCFSAQNCQGISILFRAKFNSLKCPQITVNNLHYYGEKHSDNNEGETQPSRMCIWLPSLGFFLLPWSCHSLKHVWHASTSWPSRWLSPLPCTHFLHLP